ncbi:MAG: NfeD family protein [Spirulinaceae cyanobacterium]
MPNPTLIWLIAGSLLCLTELVLPSAFVSFMMGLSALMVAGIALILPQFTLQVAIWLILSTALIFLSRRLFSPNRPLRDLGEDSEGRTLTAIEPGEAGRVLYEGNSWRAKCAEDWQAIAASEKVYILRKEGNTLIVLPQKILSS